MALKILGSADCPVCDQLAPVGLSREGEGQAVHLLCTPCGVNVQARRTSAYGQDLIRRAHGLDRRGGGPAISEAVGAPSEPHANESETTEVGQLKPGPKPATTAGQESEPELARASARWEEVI